jgi:hypothetical protein
VVSRRKSSRSIATATSTSSVCRDQSARPMRRATAPRMTTSTPRRLQRVWS